MPAGLLIAAVAMTLDSIMPAISSLSSVGFALWFAHYATTVAMPKQQAEHREAMREQCHVHATTIKELVGELREHRESYDRWKDCHAARQVNGGD